MNSENGFLKYENGKMLWSKQIYCQNNGHFSFILVKLPECAAWSKCARNSKKFFIFQLHITYIQDSKLAFENKLLFSILEHPSGRHSFSSWYNFSKVLLPHSALSCNFSSAENLARFSLQDRATKWHYYQSASHRTVYIEVESLSNHWSDLNQIWNLS